MYGEENIISAVIHVDETTPHLHCDFQPLTGESSAKDVDRRQRNAQDAREISCKQCKKGCLRAKFARLEPEKAQFNGLDQKLYER